jgi:thioredoxin 1
MGKHTVDLSDAEFQSHVLESEQPVLVDFQTSTCAPCRAIAPLLETLGQKYAGKMKIVKINCDDNQENAQTYGVRAFPTLLFFKKGKVVDQLVGAAPMSKLEERILNAL